MGTATEYSGAGLSTQGGDGLSARKFHANQAVVAAEFDPPPCVNDLLNKKTGLNDQRMAEKPGEFSNQYSVGSRRIPVWICTRTHTESVFKFKEHGHSGQRFVALRAK